MPDSDSHSPTENSGRTQTVIAATTLVAVAAHLVLLWLNLPTVAGTSI